MVLGADILHRKPRPTVRGEKGAIVSLYKNPPPDTKVICVDEMGPVSAKPYPAPRWSEAGYRPRLEADYGRRGKVWVFGGFEPRTGEALTVCAPRRDSHHFLLFLDALVQRWPDHELILILDNLSIHRSINVLLWALLHPRVRFLFQPTYAPGSISLNPGGRPCALSLSKAVALRMRL